MGRHITDWMPDTPASQGERDETVSLGEFTASKHMSVSNAFAAHGLELLPPPLLRRTSPTCIDVVAKPGVVEVGVPCNTAATLCLPRSAQDTTLFRVASTKLMLDDVEVDAVEQGEHLCAAQPVSCGKDGTKRRITAQERLIFVPATQFI